MAKSGSAIPFTQSLPDRIAILFSGTCAVHCLLTPVLLVVLPALGASFLADERFHLLLLGLSLPVSAYALTLGCRRHRDRRVLGLGIAGLAVLIAAAIAGHELLGDAGERALTLIGAVLLAAGHMRNYRLCRSDVCPT